jgi:hypothetical protein
VKIEQMLRKGKESAPLANKINHAAGSILTARLRQVLTSLMESHGLWVPPARRMQQTCPR